MEIERDPISGQNTTGHEWDGVKELNAPVPLPVKIFYLLFVIAAVIMWVLLPSWPIPGSGGLKFTQSTTGLLGHDDKNYALAELAKLNKERAGFEKVLLNGEFDALVADPKIKEKYSGVGASLFKDNCAACHGRDAKGQPGFPNLVDNVWLWDGSAEGIYTTIKTGINTSHDDSQAGEMPAFGKDETLTKDQVADVTEYVLSVSGKEALPEAAKRGKEVFENECTGCHGDSAEGNTGTGAPSLVDKAVIYGGDRKAIRKSVHSGRAGVMPHWDGRLREFQMKALALYVKWRSLEESAKAKQASKPAVGKKADES